MIEISGKTVRPDSVGNYPSGSLESQILNKMAASSAKYSYDSADPLRFELQLRKEIVGAAKDLNRSGFDFAVFRDAKCNEAFWDKLKDGGFKLKDGANPALAVQDITRNGSKYASECATAMVIVLYTALLRVYGEKRFNQAFPKIELMNWHKLDQNLRGFGQMNKHPDYFPGDRRYFSNPDVDPITPQWQGENVIDLDGKLYYGHGIGILDADSIIRALNKNRIPGADKSAFLMDAAGRPDFKSLAVLAAS